MAILLDDKVFFVVFGLFGDRDDLSPTRTLFGFRVGTDDRFDLFADNTPAPRIVGVPSALFEQSLNLACTFLFRFELILDQIDFQSSQSIQLQFQDGIGLFCIQSTFGCRKSLHDLFGRVRFAFGFADDAYDFVQCIKDEYKAF